MLSNLILDRSLTQTQKAAAALEREGVENRVIRVPRVIAGEGCSYCASDMRLPVETLVTVIGNLIENAFESMNSKGPAYDGKKELIFGIFSRPGGVLITVQDTGEGIKAENRQQIFENGFSTKGDGRGTGLYQVKSMVESLGGKICVESQEGVGASFCVKFGKEGI